jgi:Na+/melibiose symporter-like transporter
LTVLGISGLHRNARTSILTEPLWAIFGTAALFYLPLFMKDVGLSTFEIGLVISINLYLAAVIQVLAGVVTNRLGRKRATFIFDVTSWVVPMAIWAVSDNFWFFLVGYLLNATSKVVNVSFWLLATEDSEERQRPRIFAAIKVIILLAGLLVPAVGYFADRYGELPTFRVLFVLGTIAMLAHNLIRNAYSDETEAGLRAMELHQSVSLRHGVLDSIRLLGLALRNSTLRRVVGFFVFSTMAVSINIFLSVYLARGLGFSGFVVGLVPAVAACGALLCFLVVMPALERRASTGRLAVYSAGVTAAGWVMFLFTGPGAVALLLAGVAVFSIGTFALESYRDALVVSCVHPDDRADLFAAVQSLAGVLAIPGGLIAALLYDATPKLLFGAILALYAATLLCGLGSRFSQQVTVRLRSTEPAGTA